mgnify:FL=1
MSRSPYRKQILVTDIVNGYWFQFSRERLQGKPAGYVRILSTIGARIFAQYESVDNAMTELGETVAANIAFEITDPIVSVIVIPTAAATITVYAVSEAIGPTETAVLKTMVKIQKEGLM